MSINELCSEDYLSSIFRIPGDIYQNPGYYNPCDSSCDMASLSFDDIYAYTYVIDIN